MPKTREDRIRERAYAIWERQGGEQGRQDDHWWQAEAEIEAEDRLSAPQAARATPVPDRGRSEPRPDSGAVTEADHPRAAAPSAAPPAKAPARRSGGPRKK